MKKKLNQRSSLRDGEDAGRTKSVSLFFLSIFRLRVTLDVVFLFLFLFSFSFFSFYWIDKFEMLFLAAVDRQTLSAFKTETGMEKKHDLRVRFAALKTTDAHYRDLAALNRGWCR